MMNIELPQKKEEALELLNHRTIANQAMGLRYLEAYGTLEDIDLLLGIASENPSISIRNIAADCVADILSRHRIGAGKEILSYEQRVELLAKFRKVRSSKTATVFLMYGMLGIDKALNVLMMGLFDPRTELQNCAVAGLRCYCLSADTLEDQSIETKLVSILEDSKVSIPVQAHILRLCVESGYQSVLRVLPMLDSVGVLNEVIPAAQIQLNHNKEPSVGIWYSNGLDAIEYNPAKEDVHQFLLLTKDRAICCKEGQWFEVEAIENQVHRKLYFRGIGKEGLQEAIQMGLDTWVKADNLQIEALIKQEAMLDVAGDDFIQTLADYLQSQIQEGDKSKYWHVVAMFNLRTQNWSMLQHACEQALLVKKPSNDIYYFQAKYHLAMGNKKAAAAALETCIASCRSIKSTLAKLCLSLQETL